MTEPTLDDGILHRIAALERARVELMTEGRVPMSDVLEWSGRPILDPGGKRIGHVSRVRPDGTGGAWLEAMTDWGLLDLLSRIGAGHVRMTFHSDDMEPRGETLVLKRGVLEPGAEAA